MKKMYEMPEVTFETFAIEDVITTSNDIDTGDGGTTGVNPFTQT